MLHEIDVERIAGLAELEILPVGPVDVGLDLYVGAFTAGVLPPRQDVPSRDVSRSILRDLGGRRKRRDKRPLAALDTVDIALHRKRILVPAFPIRAESHLSHAPMVEIVVIGMIFR